MRNRGELAEGWYDPATLQKAQPSESTNNPRPSLGGEVPQSSRGCTSDAPRAIRQEIEDQESDSDDPIGPALPGQERTARSSGRVGPSIPNMQDLELRKGKVFIRACCISY